MSESERVTRLANEGAATMADATIRAALDGDPRADAIARATRDLCLALGLDPVGDVMDGALLREGGLVRRSVS